MSWVGMSSYSWGGSGSAPYLNNILAGPQQFADAVSSLSPRHFADPRFHALA